MCFNKGFRAEVFENKRIELLPRFVEATVKFLNKNIRIVDNASFLFIKNELFTQQIYKFKSVNESPYIIDCGANIGLSIIYFKQLYPNAEIIAFEPDDKVFQALEYNIGAFNLSNVELIKRACWNEETILNFYSEGADGGRTAKDFDTQNIIEVKSIRLINFLNRRVDFLKIDIEGAENEVIHDIEHLLTNVERIFVEFHSFIGREQMLPEILSILKKAGFRLNIHHIGVYSPNPFISVFDYSNMDLQLNIFGYRL